MTLKSRRRSHSRYLDGTERRNESHRLARSSHIFAATVREALESNVLRRASSLPLTLSQLYLLRLMGPEGRYQAGELAGFLGISAPAATKTIEKLVRLGLLNRSASEGDRRATMLAVSTRGRRLVERYEELKTERMEKAVAALEERDVRRLQQLLERLSIALLMTAEGGDRACLRCAAYLEEDCRIGQLQGGCRFEGLLPMAKARGVIAGARREAAER